MSEWLRAHGFTFDDPETPAGLARIGRMLLTLWFLCLLIGSFGCVAAWGAAAPRASWPYVGAILCRASAPGIGAASSEERTSARADDVPRSSARMCSSRTGQRRPFLSGRSWSIQKARR